MCLPTCKRSVTNKKAIRAEVGGYILGNVVKEMYSLHHWECDGK